MAPFALCSLTTGSVTLGYVHCQDLKKSFDSPDQLVMVIRAPPETQMQVSEPSKVQASLFFFFFSTSSCQPQEIFHLYFYTFVHHVFRVTRSPWRARRVQLTFSSVRKTAPASAVPWQAAVHPNPKTLTPPWPRPPHHPQTHHPHGHQTMTWRGISRHQHLRHPRWQPPPSRTPRRWG